MQFAVSGYYGCGNAGDEAVLAGINEAFARRAGDSVNLVVLSQNPAATSRLHGLAAVDRMNLSVVRRILADSDMLLSGGGSLLQDTTSMRSLLYYLWIVRLAYNLRVPVMFYAQGLGPLRRALSRTLVRMVANRAAYITVRDEPSARLLMSLGVSRPTVEVTADPAFALSPAPDAFVEKLFEAEGLPTDAPLIGVALRAWGGASETNLNAYARLLTELEAQCRARVALLPMQTPGDVAFAEEVARRSGASGAFAIIRHSYPPDTLLGLVGRMQAVVAMRLHALIFAARAGAIPFALSYDPKVENLMRGLGLADSLEAWHGFDPEEVAARVAALLADREARVAALRAQTPDLERLALRNADCALDVAERLHRDSCRFVS
ncbi:MAG TPA: polysaccharide pyruvyl transferase CsaB [Chthonomonadaceae bacterium]|nr:polysaccharide pyruvyl transferase CsaB [Chthonomonadaceae bacterium]